MLVNFTKQKRYTYTSIALVLSTKHTPTLKLAVSATKNLNAISVTNGESLTPIPIDVYNTVRKGYTHIEVRKASRKAVQARST